ncbi:type II toxin-antitoxin system VapC family toxin [Sulfurisphaera ohwakuensis]|uniref:PIN domain-containing protein n=1 Tax=Sulfurisphaera ohwakuensis TaxID=69656 RepID=A0A650CIY8_SULOH|nr:type II toxin-antitoxin system VapC family toxin [Sulfurisphaera ohwakuensis]MBB5253841.1 putative nucleic acid-binding protein [Sulfurisphaera ohwakuensis]QGR17487.1 PIN domain-containing protein [Sulfurisphaera ohwakuensis]
MKYVLDTSAIINLIQRLKDESIDLFKECITADLVYYELGNFLWKIKRIDLLSDFTNILKFIRIENVTLSKEVLEIAINENLTYYDATYLFLSRKYNIPLVSDDKDLISRGAIESKKIKN